MLLLYHGLAISRCIYALPLLPFSTAQWEKLGSLHRVCLRVFLGVLKFLDNIERLGTVDPLLVFQVEAIVLRHIARLHITSYILQALSSRLNTFPRKHKARLVKKLDDLVGPPLSHPSTLPL